MLELHLMPIVLIMPVPCGLKSGRASEVAVWCSQLVRRWVGPAHDGAKISLRSQVEHFVAPKLRPALIFGKLTWGLVTPFARVRRNPFAFASEEGWCEVFKSSRSAGLMRGLAGLG